MRVLALAMLIFSAVLNADPAAARAYDPKYPACLESYSLGGGRSIDCSYDNLAQCNATAQGQGGQCLDNPFFAGANDSAGPRRPRPRVLTKRDCD